MQNTCFFEDIDESTEWADDIEKQLTQEMAVYEEPDHSDVYQICRQCNSIFTMPSCCLVDIVAEYSGYLKIWHVLLKAPGHGWMVTRNWFCDEECAMQYKDVLKAQCLFVLTEDEKASMDGSSDAEK